jgi:ankyrin repeat protein
MCGLMTAVLSAEPLGWHDAAEAGDLARVQSLLQEQAQWLNSTDHEGETALMEAAEEGRLEVVRWLLSRGARVDWQDTEGETALMEAVEAGHLPVAELLLSYGSPVGTVDAEDRSALDRAEAPALQSLLRARGAR